MEMWMRFALRGDIAVTRFVQAYKRLHGRNMSKSYFALRDLRERFKAIEYAFARDSQTCTRHGLSRDYVRRSMAGEALWIANGCLGAGERRAARDCLEYAVELWPAIAKSAGWRKTQLKYHVSPWLFEQLRALAAWFHQLSADPHYVPDPRRGPRPGTLQGWWPQQRPDHR
jgi:hypothetical protein